MLWENHGCPSQFLYGDDGEMQCNNFDKHRDWIDFKRDSVALINWKLMNEVGKRVFPRPEK
jgi:hypothetical protein